MFIEYRCDGIIHCIEGTDEYNCHKQYTAVKEKRFFSSEATLLCQENRTDDPTTSAPEIHKQWPMIWYSFTQIFFYFSALTIIQFLGPFLAMDSPSVMIIVMKIAKLQGFGCSQFWAFFW